jgi:hypothetical protein
VDNADGEDEYSDPSMGFTTYTSCDGLFASTKKGIVYPDTYLQEGYQMRLRPMIFSSLGDLEDDYSYVLRVQTTTAIDR